MPTSTFFNLPPPKREKLLQAAIAEFTRQPYGEVSLSRIIRAAGIPRGSFYQYFADKTDLFRYVLSRYAGQLEALILKSLEACGGRVMELPLTLFDELSAYVQAAGDGLRTFLGLLKQNVAVDVRQLWDFKGLVPALLEAADWHGLNVHGPGEQIALLDLILSSTAHALMSAGCGKCATEQCRSHLEHKIALVKRGVEVRTDPPLWERGGGQEEP